MSSPTWFNSPARIAQLDTVAASWVGTPWAPNSQVKGAGGGVCCHMLPYAILRETGLALPFSAPIGRADWSVHNNLSLIEPFLDQRPEFSAISEDPEPGDLLCFKIGRCTHHLGVMLSGYLFVHVWQQTGVICSTLDDSTYAPRLIRRWRPLP